MAEPPGSEPGTLSLMARTGIVGALNGCTVLNCMFGLFIACETKFDWTTLEMVTRLGLDLGGERVVAAVAYAPTVSADAMCSSKCRFISRHICPVN